MPDAQTLRVVALIRRGSFRGPYPLARQRDVLIDTQREDLGRSLGPPAASGAGPGPLASCLVVRVHCSVDELSHLIAGVPPPTGEAPCQAAGILFCVAGADPDSGPELGNDLLPVLEAAGEGASQPPRPRDCVEAVEQDGERERRLG